MHYKVYGDKFNNYIKTVDLACNGWHKYTFVRQGKQVFVFFDDQQLATKTIAENVDFGSVNICFGAYINEAWSYQNSSLVYDNVAIYDYALTANQIAALTAGKM